MFANAMPPLTLSVANEASAEYYVTATSMTFSGAR